MRFGTQDVDVVTTSWNSILTQAFGASASVDNSANPFQGIIIFADIDTATAPGAGGYGALWLQESVDGGTTYPDVAGVGRLITTFVLAGANVVHVVSEHIFPVGEFWRIVLGNHTDQTAGADMDLKYQGVNYN